ncbi:hypothetical protein KZZ52_33775 [Dactylosporangium sp. AC04546]|uniref:hypothetical protein n=1 Tax=Dactylosporangium sp. AC04546 TaxID=2862460 RepID=UPI001EDD3F58|nr:hypothetical protein [Dactylosporangium sp. AC04546]WVK78945.1 hypothetical protein KZZ52_33775 [Dactylosporangium sp. AC04546]
MDNLTPTARKTLEALRSGPGTALELSQRTSRSRSATDKALADLAAADLAVIINAGPRASGTPAIWQLAPAQSAGDETGEPTGEPAADPIGEAAPTKNLADGPASQPPADTGSGDGDHADDLPPVAAEPEASASSPATPSAAASASAAVAETTSGGASSGRDDTPGTGTAAAAADGPDGAGVAQAEAEPHATGAVPANEKAEAAPAGTADPATPAGDTTEPDAPQPKLCRGCQTQLPAVCPNCAQKTPSYCANCRQQGPRGRTGDPTILTNGLPRLARGELETMVANVMRTNSVPDHLGVRGWTCGRIAVFLPGRSTGAINNALRRMAANGTADLLGHDPERYGPIGNASEPETASAGTESSQPAASSSPAVQARTSG